MILSPHATPYNPFQTKDDFEIAVYNDGVPSMVPIDTHGCDDMMHGISDDAIDECFPPTAEEVSEIEACEIFVEMMALYSIMEDAEEKARVEGDLTVLHHKKRWAARRVDGLLGKPHPARSQAPEGHHHQKGKQHGQIDTVDHDDEKALVTMDHNLYRKQMHMANLEKRIRSKELYKISKHAADSRTTAGLHGRKPRNNFGYYSKSI